MLMATMLTHYVILVGNDYNISYSFIPEWPSPCNAEIAVSVVTTINDIVRNIIMPCFYQVSCSRLL